MQIRLRDIFICLAILCVVFALAKPDVVAVADGHFRLSITSTSAESLPASLMIAYCWDEDEMVYAEAHGREGEITFRQADQDSDGIVTINLPHSSKRNSRRELSYHEPKFIVIQFESNGRTQRKSFAIPEGRGDRELGVGLD